MILGGTVRYEDAVKANPADQYSTSRKIAVELNFAVPEDPGVDPSSVLRAAMDEAISLTNEKLGLKAPTRNALTTVMSPPVNIPQSQPAATRTKADLAIDAFEKAEGKKRGPKPKAKVADDWEAQPANTAVPSATAIVTEPVAASASDEWEVPAQTEIPDTELHKAVQAKAEKVASVKIRELIATFNPDPKKPFKISLIEQGQRQTFLDKLKGLA